MVLWGLAAVLALYVLPPALGFAFFAMKESAHWSAARRDSSGQAPDPAATREAVVQVYAARAWGWRRAFGVHSWIAAKRRGAAGYDRHEVIGWGVRYGREAVRSGPGIPDGHWFGARPALLAELRGPAAEAAIGGIERAAARYPHRDRYAAWPGPNSNTFTAFVLRAVPELRADLPPTAVGKDYLPEGRVFARAPSGTGFQVSLRGLAGAMLALDEGIEVNLLGLVVGLDLAPPALKLPGVGRIGWR